eukprot:9491957-Pyramimonas_sp.AAC.1
MPARTSDASQRRAMPCSTTRSMSQHTLQHECGHGGNTHTQKRRSERRQVRGGHMDGGHRSNMVRMSKRAMDESFFTQNGEALEISLPLRNRQISAR